MNWSDQARSEHYVTFKLLEAEALLRQGQAASANSLLSNLRVVTPVSRPEVQRQTLLGQSFIALAKWEDGVHAVDTAYDLASAQHWDEPRLKALITKGYLFSSWGKLDEAEAIYRSALGLAGELNDQYTRMSILLNLGFNRLKRSQYDEAIPYFEKAQRAGESARVQQPVSIALDNLAICHYRLGDFDGALNLLRQAITVQEKIKAQGNLVYSYGELGNIYLLEGQVLRAVPNYERAVQLATNLGSDQGVLLWAQNLASAYIELRDWDKAERLNQQARAIADRTHDQNLMPHLRLNSAAIAAGRGRAGEAIRLYQEAMSASGETPPNIVWEAQAGMADAYEAGGDDNQARTHFENALHAIEQARAGLSHNEYKIAFLSQLIRFYQDYVELLLEQGDYAKALAVADSSRARLLAERLDSGSATAIESKARDFQAVAKSAKAVLLSYWIAPKRSVVWLITPGKTRMIVLPADKVAIQRLVESYDAELQRGLRDPVTSGSTAGSRLYEVLVKPVEAFIPPGASVIVVPDGPLHNLNFETLPTSGAHPRYWIERVTLSVAPSLELLAQSQPRGSRPTGVLLIGNPEPVDQYPSLANAEREIEALRVRFPSRSTTVLTGAQATPSIYTQIKPERFALIHFTAHAEANREHPLDSAVILSKKDDEYKLYARDLLATPLRADLVTVSACRSAGATAYAGEGLVGFAWAFLHAGAKNVIAGLWNVDDSSTARLMEQMYTEIAAGAAPDRALRDAKLSLIHSTGNYHKPYYWAPFQVYRRSVQ